MTADSRNRRPFRRCSRVRAPSSVRKCFEADSAGPRPEVPQARPTGRITRWSPARQITWAVFRIPVVAQRVSRRRTRWPTNSRNRFAGAGSRTRASGPPSSSRVIHEVYPPIEAVGCDRLNGSHLPSAEGTYGIAGPLHPSFEARIGASALSPGPPWAAGRRAILRPHEPENALRGLIERIRDRCHRPR